MNADYWPGERRPTARQRAVIMALEALGETVEYQLRRYREGSADSVDLVTIMRGVTAIAEAKKAL